METRHNLSIESRYRRMQLAAKKILTPEIENVIYGSVHAHM